MPRAALRALVPETTPGRSRLVDGGDWLGRIESAFQIIAAASDAGEVTAALCSEVGRLLGEAAVVEFLPVGAPGRSGSAEGTAVPVKTQRGQIGTLFIRGTVSHDALRAVRLLAGLAGQIGSRSLHDQRLQVAQRHERNAVAVYQAARDLVTISDVDVVLDAITRRAQEFTGADVAYLAIQVPGSEVYEHRAPSGTRTSRLDEIRVDGLKGLTEIAARERQVIVSNDFFNDPRRNTALDGHLRAEGVVSLMCAPMYMGDEFVGALFVADRRPGSLSDADADLLAALGAIAAGAIVNARLHAAERRRNDELARINELVASQHAQLEKWVKTHQRLTRMGLDGQSLPRIAAVIAQIVGNPVVITDRVGGARTFVRPRGERSNEIDDGLDELVAGRIAGDAPAPDRISRISVPKAGVDALVAPVTTRSGVLGYVVVVESCVQLDDQTRTFIGQAANAVAIEFMQERVAAEVETRLRGELLGELITQNVSDQDELRKRAALLGHDLDGELRLIVVKADDMPHGNQGAESEVPVNVALAEALGPRVPPPLLVARRGRGVALLTRPAGGRSHIVEDLEACAALRERISARLNRPVSLVAGSWVSDPNELAASFASIVNCLDAYAATGRRAFVVDFERSSFDRILVEIARSGEAPAFVAGVIGPVLEYDRRRQGSLIESLEQYLLADSVLESAARALHVHPHTLRYRLDKVTQLTGRSTSDPEAKLELLLALRLFRSLAASQASMRPTAG